MGDGDVFCFEATRTALVMDMAFRRDFETLVNIYD